MPLRRIRSERMTALFLLGVVAFNPPLLSVFDAGPEAMVFGVPVLVFYLFVAWGGLIALLARAFRGNVPPPPPGRPRT